MPSFTVRAPNGQSYDVTAPDGATQEQVFAYVASQHPQAAAPPQAAPQAPQATPAPAKAPTPATAQPGPGLGQLFGDAAMTLQRALPGVSEASALIDSRLRTGADLLTGKVKLDPNDLRGSLGRVNAAAFAASRARQQGMVDELKAHSRLASDLATGTGYAAQVVPALLSGGETVAPQVEAAVAPGVRAALKRFAVRTAAAAPKSATTGAAFAAVNAAAQPGTVAERVNAANDAIIPGAALGVAIPAAIDAGSGAVRHLAAPAVNVAADTATKFLDPVAARAAVTAPEVRAAQAIQNAIDRDEAAGHVIDPTQPLRHAGGENVAALYDVVAQSPGPGRQLMKQAIDAHAAATSAGIKADIGEALGGKGDYFATQDALSAQRRADAAPHRDAAFAEPIGTDKFDQTFGPIMARLPSGAAAAAADIARMEGRNPDELGLTMMDSFEGTPVRDGAATPENVSLRDLKSLQRGSKVGFGQGLSLIKFLSTHGLQDEGREVSGIGGDVWHKGAPFRRQLIQPDGLTLERAAELAHDAGYFPDAKVPTMDSADNMHPVSPADLLAAMEDEMHGKPRFAREPDPKALARLGRLDELGGRLDAAHANIHELDKQSAGQVLADHEADLLRLEAHLDGEAPPMSENVQTRAVTPTLETLHYIKKGIDQTLEPYRNQVTGRLDLTNAPKAQAANGVRADLARAMRQVSPAYDKFMQSWGDDSDNLAALKLGRNVFSDKFDMNSENLARLHNGVASPETGKLVGGMSDEAKAQFRKGVGEAILAAVRKPGGGGIAAVRRLLLSQGDEFRSRVSLAFGDNPDAFDQFLGSMQARADQAARDARYMGGSPTYGRQAARADLEKEPPHPYDVAAEVVGGNPLFIAGRLARAGIKALPRGTPKSAIMDPRSNAMLGKSATDPAEVERLLKLLQVKRRVSKAPQLQAHIASGAGRVAGAIAGAGQRPNGQ